jgi:hypothetical protein
LLVEVGGSVSSTNTDWIDVVEGITGTVKIPAGATVGGDGAHSAGVAGYAESTSPNVGPVGIYGRGVSLRTAAADMNVFGGNVVGSVPPTYKADILHGFEVDVDIRGTVNTIQGLKVIGAGGGTVSGSGYALYVDDMQDSNTPWDFGLFTVEGAVDAGLYFSAKEAGAGASDSPFMELWSRTGGDSDQAWRIWNNSANQLIFWPRVNSGEIRIRDNAGTGNNIIMAGETGNVTSVGTIEGATLTESSNAVPNATDHLGFFGGTTVAQLAAELTDEDYAPGDSAAVGAATKTLTNTTMDAEGTGNTLTIPSDILLPVVGCAGTTGTLMWDTLATLAPTATCSAGTTNTNMMRGVADFPDSDGDYSIQYSLKLPEDWTGNVDLRGYWRTTLTSGDVVWQVQTACRDDAEVDDVAWNSAQTVADTAKGTTNQLNAFSLSTLTMTGCSAGDIWHVRVLRNRTHASDTLGAAAASLAGSVSITLRRAI